MAVTVTYSNYFFYKLAKKAIDLSADTVKVLLMRDGYVFDRDLVEQAKNISCNSGAISITFDDTGKTITRGSGSFITDGFIVGNLITTDAALNPGPFTITDVQALVITVSESVIDEGPVTKTVTSSDELATGNGYTRNTKTTGTITVTQNETDNRCDCTYPTVTWTASGGDIGPTPGAMLVDTTADVVIQYIDFGGNQTATDTNPFNIASGNIRLQGA